MTAGAVVLPAQGTGSTQPNVAVDTIATKEYQFVKLVDGTINGTTPAGVTSPADGSATQPGLWVNGQLMLFNGATWDRARGDVANGLDVDVTRVPADPFGNNADASAPTGGAGSISAKLRTMTGQLNQLATGIQIAGGTVSISGTTPVSDAGGSLTVDGAVTANLGTLNGAATDAVLHADLGQPADAEATGNGTINALIKRLRTLLAGGLPAALVGGRLDTNLGAWLGSTTPTVGQKTMAQSIPVVIASDQTNVPVTGGGGGGGDGAILDGVSALIKATVKSYTNSKPLAVVTVDTNGDPVVASGGGAQYVEDAVSPANPTGTAPMLVRDDAPAALVSTNQDWVAGRGTNKGEQYVKHLDPIPVTDNGGSLTVDGTVGISGTVPVSDASGSLTTDTPQLPAALVGGRLDANVGAWLGSTAPTAGQKTMVNSLPVAIASDQSAVPVSGTVTATLPNGTNNIGDVDVLTVPADPFGANADAAATAGAAGSMQAKFRLMTSQLASIVTALAGGLPAALVGGRLDINNGAWLGSTAPTVGQKTAANSIPAVLASDQSAINIKSATGDEVAMLRTTLDPVDGAGTTVPIKFARVNATADGNNTIVAGVASKKLRVLGYAIVVTAAGTISIQDSAGTPNILAQFPLVANGGVSYAGGLDAPAFETVAGNGLVINNPAGVDTLGHLVYQEI